MQDQEKLMQQLKDAVVAIKKLKADLQAEREKDHEPVAIIGMAMRLPGDTNTAERYWELLETGFDAITDIPKARFDAKKLFTTDPNEPGKITLLQGGFVKDIDQFDGSFFDISYAELENLDPQQRMLLEVSYEAIENAGINAKSLIDSDTGVFVGVTNVDYQTKSYRTGDYTSINHYSYSGQAICAHSGRISYLMGFQGPSIALDTACSSSLVATHLAVRALRNRESGLALVGACNLIVDPEQTIYFSHLNALSKDSRCKSFSNDGNGFVRSEGCGVVVLKRLADAQRDGDNILAIIKGTAVNQDGKSNGFTAPSVKAQIKLLETALKDALLTAEQVDFIEAHGTGTKIGDPIEMDAISAVYKKHKTKDQPLLVGSVKSNIGHTESVAGMAGMMKMVLALQHKKIPQNLHFEHPNELIDWQGLPITVPTRLTNWDKETRYAGISGFGVTGTNAHVILGNAPTTATPEIHLPKDIYVLTLSAKTDESLRLLVKKYISFIEAATAPLEDICAMAALKRTHWEERTTFLARSKEEMIEKLKDFSEMEYESSKLFDEETVPPVVFVFPGQGSQWIGMGKQLMEHEEVFKTAMLACSDAFKKFIDWDLIEELNKPEATSRLNEIDIVQPALVAIEIALAKLWQSKGIHPEFVVGHSMGEAAAAYIAGILSMDEAAQVICLRSKLMKSQSGKGEMGVTDLTEQEARQYISGREDKLSIAVMNSPTSTVIAGEPEALNAVFTQLEAAGRFCRKVKVDVASHSPQMDPIKEELRQALQNLQPKDGEISFFSTALNKVIKGSELNADYWVNNLRNPVQFGSVIRSILEKDDSVFLEMSPHPVLLNAIQENIQASGKKAKGIPSIFREKDEVLDFMANLAALHNTGYPIDWKAIYPSIGRFVVLPNYAWVKERFWYDKKHYVGQQPITQPAEAYLYNLSWKEVDIQRLSLSGKRILVANGQHSLGQRIIEKLQAANQVIEWNGADVLEKPDLVLVLGISTFDVPSTAIQQLEVQERNCMNAINVLAFLNKKNWHTQVVIATNGSQQVLSTDTINLNGAGLFGMGRTLDNEHSEFKHYRIDLPYEPSEEELSSFIGILGSNNQYKEISIRSNQIKSHQIVACSEEISDEPIAYGSGTYLVTGGTSGLGLLYAEWLATQGVKQIALVSRSGAKPETNAAVQRMQANGSQVNIYKGDIGNLSDLMTLLTNIQQQQSSLSGVVHAAGILDDGSLLQLTDEKFKNVMQAKVVGAWNLHLATKEMRLSHFILFSSGASILGTSGQGNYVAANSYLDQLAHYRTSIGLPALAINWGNIGEVGLAASDANRGKRLVEQGMGVFSPKDLPVYFKALLQAEGAQWMLMDIDFKKWAAANPAVKQNTLYGNFIEINETTATQQGGFGQATTYAQALKQVRDFVKSVVSATTKVPVNKIKEDATFKSMGIDSLMALQLKNKFQTEYQLNLAVSSIWTYPTVEKYSEFLAKELKLDEQFAEKKAAPTVASVSQEEFSVDNLSFEDLMKQLEEKTK